MGKVLIIYLSFLKLLVKQQAAGETERIETMKRGGGTVNKRTGEGTMGASGGGRQNKTACAKFGVMRCAFLIFTSVGFIGTSHDDFVFV